MAQKRDFCTKEGGCITGRIHGLFEDASKIQIKADSFIVPGLFQTEEYGLALRRWSQEHFGRPHNDLVEQVRIRRRVGLQHTVFEERQPPLQVQALISESIFVRGMTSTEALHRQIRHLAAMATKPNIDIRLLPVWGAPLDEMHYATPADAFVTLVDTLVDGRTETSLLRESEEVQIVTAATHPEQVADAERVFEKFRATALSREVTADILGRRAMSPPDALRNPANLYYGNPKPLQTQWYSPVRCCTL